MKKAGIILTIVCLLGVLSLSFNQKQDTGTAYAKLYLNKVEQFNRSQQNLLQTIQHASIADESGLGLIKNQIHETRIGLKKIDFWARYFEPIHYKKMNGPLPVEWETEVFEKYEKPYKREGAGLTLAELYLDENSKNKDFLLQLVQSSIDASNAFVADSITENLQHFSSFYLCNRLFLLNLATIYSTGFECPDTSRIIPELHILMEEVDDINHAYNVSFPNTALSNEYLQLYSKALEFIKKQPLHYSSFDHYSFIRDFVNPLFAYNQRLMQQFHVTSRSSMDYSLSKTAGSIFSKDLYYGQNDKGIYLRVKDSVALRLIDSVGKLLFYDPILSANNQRSCNSCHNSAAFFTDPAANTSLQLNRKQSLTRNTPTLINVTYNHLLMLDGKHISMQDQAKAVITNPIELGTNEKEVMNKVLSCSTYKNIFQQLLLYTPQYEDITINHIVSAITFYYSKFSKFSAPFDEMMNNFQHPEPIDAGVQRGFNIFMSKAQCATCHFAPHFNGVKPPYVGSEFEVLGVPADSNYSRINADEGRFGINPANETMHAFRTGTLRNADHTMPYMHNGVFQTMRQVIDFYDGGGGAGRGLNVPNQTLSSDSLKLSEAEKNDLMLFISSLNENIKFEPIPTQLPVSADSHLNKRKVGGEY
jgi:cytochrome c peroxidase